MCSSGCNRFEGSRRGTVLGTGPVDRTAVGSRAEDRQSFSGLKGFLTDPKVVTKILAHLNLPSAPLGLAPPVARDEPALIPEQDWVQVDADTVWCEPETEGVRGARDPPHY
jgi:hypothetical protein